MGDVGVADHRLWRKMSSLCRGPVGGVIRRGRRRSGVQRGVDVRRGAEAVDGASRQLQHCPQSEGLQELLRWVSGGGKPRHPCPGPTSLFI